MKKYKGMWIAAIILACIGIIMCIVGGVLGAFTIASGIDNVIESVRDIVDNDVPHKTETTMTAETGDYTKISLDLENFSVILRSTNSSEPQVSYKESKDYTVNTQITDDTLVIKGTNNKMLFSNPEIIVYLPPSYEVSIDSDNTAVRAKGVFFTSFICNSSNAAISLEDITVGLGINIDTDNSAVSLDSVKCKTGDIVISTDNAVISCDDISCCILSLSTDTALCSVEDVTASKVMVTTDTGLVNFSSLHADNIDITTDTGNVTGELEGRKADYTITVTANSKTTTDGSGSKTVNINTDTGIVKLEYDD